MAEIPFLARDSIKRNTVTQVGPRPKPFRTRPGPEVEPRMAPVKPSGH